MVFIDEAWAKTNMTRTRVWGDKGKPLLAKVPHGHWKTLTSISGLQHDGSVAPSVIDGPIDGESFAAWVEQFLIPDLKPEASSSSITWAVTKAPACAGCSGRPA